MVNRSKFPSVAETKQLTQEETSTSKEDVKYEEITDLRTADSKTYKGSDGSMKKVITVSQRSESGSALSAQSDTPMESTDITITSSEYNGLNYATLDESDNLVTTLGWGFGYHGDNEYFAIGEFNLYDLYDHYGINANEVTSVGLLISVISGNASVKVAYDNDTSYWYSYSMENAYYRVLMPETNPANGSVSFCLGAIDQNFVELNTSITYEIVYAPLTPLINGQDNGVDYKQTYVEGEVGNAGSYRINPRTGRFDLTRQLVSLGGERMPMNLSLTYNPYFVPAGFTNALGYWKFNVEQYVYQSGDDYLYIDGSYRTHTFKSAGSGVYYDNGHTGLTLSVDGNVITITDNKTNTLTFTSGKLTEIKQQKGVSSTTTTISYNGNNFTVTDGMGREATYTASATDRILTKPNGSTITFSLANNELTIEDAEETCTYAMANTPITVNSNYGQGLTIALDGNKVSSVTESLKKNGVTKDLMRYKFTYDGHATDVAQTKYPTNNEIEPTYTMRYNFSGKGEAIGSFEKTKESEQVKANNIRFRSIEDYKRYMLYLNPEYSDVGEFFDNGSTTESSVTVGGSLSDYAGVALTNGVPETRVGEELVVSMQVTPDGNYSNQTAGIYIIVDTNVEIRHIKVADIYGDGGMQPIIFRAPDQYMVVHGYESIELYIDSPFEMTLENARMTKRQRNTDIDCVNMDTSMTRYVESDGTIWYEDSTATIDGIGITDPVSLSKNDWEQTLENMHKSNGGSFLLWYGDLESAVFVNNNTNVTIGDETKSLQNIEYATVHEKGSQMIFETRDYSDSECYVKVTKKIKDGNVTKTCAFYYDQYYRLIKRVDSKGAVTTYTYDNYGNVTQEEITASGESMKKKTCYTEDGGFVYKESEYVNGIKNSTVYEHALNTGNVTKVTDPKLYATDFGYDVADNLTSILHNNNGNEFYYNTGLLSEISHNSFSYEFTYNEYNDVTQVKVGNKVLLNKTYSHGPMNETATTTYKENESTTNVYDKYGRQTVRIDTVNGVDYRAKYIYGSASDDVSNITCPYEESLTINSDSKLRKRIDNGRVTVYNYDIAGNVRDYTEKENSTTILTVNNTYDQNGRLSTREETTQGLVATCSIRYEDGDGINDDRINVYAIEYDDGECFDYHETMDEYDKFGRLSEREYYIETMYGDIRYTQTESLEYHIGNTVGETSGALKKVNSWGALGDFTYEYSYDKNGNITQYTENGVTRSYTYDSLNRLESETVNGVTTTYAYDNGGNRTQKTVNGNTQNYVYTNDRLTSWNGETFVYDEKGYPTKYKGADLTWRMGRLTSYGENTYEYDSKNVRRQKVNDEVTTKYYYDGTRLLSEKRGEVITRYLYNHEGIVGMVHDGAVYTYLKNPQGDIIGIYDYYGIECARYSYDAWGNCTIDLDVDDIGTLNPFRYRSYYYDAETGLYYLINRYYDPELGRFISPDHIGYMTEQMESINGCNLYAYCLNNPIMGVDPEGTFLWLLLAAALKFTITVVANAITGGITAAQKGEDFWKGFGAGAIAGAVEGVISLIGDIPPLRPVGHYFDMLARGASSFAYGYFNTLFQKGHISKEDWISIGTDVYLDVALSMFYVEKRTPVENTIEYFIKQTKSVIKSSAIEMGIDIIETWLFGTVHNVDPEKVRGVWS